MDRYNVFLAFMTNSGICGTMSVVIMANEMIEAGNKAAEHVMKHGGQVSLMMGAPPVPIQVAYAVPQRIDKVSASGILLDANAPTHKM